MNPYSTETVGHYSTKEIDFSNPCPFISRSFSEIVPEMEFQNHILKNSHGTEIHVTNFGGIVTRILTRDRSGKLSNIVLGFDRAQDYEKHIDHPYFGALIGRFGNRIAVVAVSTALAPKGMAASSRPADKVKS